MRRRIGFFTRGVHVVPGFAMAKELRRACEMESVDLVTFDALGSVGSPGTHALLLADARRLDGALAWVAEPGLHESFFADRFPGLPVVALTTPLPGSPLVRIDMKASMKKALRHLAEGHDRRKIAMLRAPASDPNAYFRARAEAWAEEAREGRILDDDRLQCDAPAKCSAEEAARFAVDHWLDDRGLRPGEDFDAFTSFNEATVVALAREFQRRGFSLPRDLAFVGFDNSVLGRAMALRPTVQVMPYAGQARAALDLLLRRLSGEVVDETVSLAADLERGESCGCRPASIELVERLGGSRSETAAPLVDLFDAHAEEFHPLHPLRPMAKDLYATLLGAFRADLSEGSGVFLSAFAKARGLAVASEGDASLLNDALSFLREEKIPLSGEESGAPARRADLLTLARIDVAEDFVQSDMVERARLEDEQSRLRRLVLDLSSQGDFESLAKRLARWSTDLGLEALAVVEYAEPSDAGVLDEVPTPAKAVFAWRQGKRLEGDALRRPFPVTELAPEAHGDAWTGKDLHVLPLGFGTLRLGYLLVEGAPLVSGLLSTLASQIGNAMNGFRLLEERRKAEEFLSSTTEKVRSGAEEVSVRSAEISSHVAEGSKAMDDLVAQVRRIARRAEEVLKDCESSVRKAEEAVRHMADLDALAREASEVTSLIARITGNANLLSINAQIEAAHAGALGKGFAVVADEINRVALSTRENARTIEALVRGVQQRSERTREIIASVVELDQSVRALSRAIGEAAETHSEATARIGVLLAEAAEGSRQMSASIRKVADVGSEEDPGRTD